jgi:branched-chain amino acid transport system ATP-binding protein
MLEVDGLHSAYGEAHVLRGVSLAVPAGRIVALLGRNGMGKTTLIRSIMNLAPPRITAGSVRYKGTDLRHMAPHRIARQRIGLVPQGRRLFASLTVVEHLTALRPVRGSSWPLERIFALFPRLAERKRHRGGQLSGGERQMLAVARALVLDPELLLMDEPSEGLAPVVVEQLEGVIAQLKSAGLAILLVEQNLYSALAVADEVYILETGRIAWQGAARELQGDRPTLERLLGVK